MDRKKIVILIATVVVAGILRGKMVSLNSARKAGKTEIELKQQATNSSATRKTNYEAELRKRMASVKDTDFDGSTAEMASQAGKAYQAWDKELNKVYKLLMSELPESRKEKLRNSERAWLKSIDKEIDKELGEICTVDSDGKRAACGTMAGIIEIGTRLERTKERTLQLAKMYDEIHSK